MGSTAYLGSQNRTFPAALRLLLEREYRLLGCRRVLDLITEDVQILIEQFYPTPERLTQHHPKSVGHYIRDYERVKLMLQQGHQHQDQLARLLNMRPAVLDAHLALVQC